MSELGDDAAAPDGSSPAAELHQLEVYRKMLKGTGVRSAAFVIPEAHLGEVLAALRSRPDVRVAVFLPSLPRTDALGRGAVTGRILVHPTHEFGAVHGLLTAMGPLDLLVDHGNGHDRLSYFRRLFFHLRGGGRYVVNDDAEGAGGTEAEGSRGGLSHALARLFEVKVSGDGRDSATADDRALAEAIESVDLDGARTEVVRTGHSQVKLRHSEANFVVRHQQVPVWTRVRSAVPAGEVDASGVIGVHNNQPLREKLYPPAFKVPRLLVREYHEVIAHPYGILQKDHLILPDTFRLWLSSRQRNNRLRDLSHYFAQLPPQGLDDLPRLSGQYYYLDLEYRYHFGHYLTDAVGRLWAWPAAKAANPELKILVGAVLGFQVDLLQAAGVAREDIVVLSTPTAVESMVAAMPGYVIGRYVSEEVTKTYRRIQSGLPQVGSPGGELVFLSREPGLWRECTNAPEVEAVFVDRGFTLHRPELYSLPEQAALFREARVVAGYIGSSLFGSIFSPDPLQVVGFVNTSYTSNNEFLIGAALGHTFHPFWGVEEDPPQRQFDVQGRPIGKAHRDYAFDFEADGGTLAALLDQLV